MVTRWSGVEFKLMSIESVMPSNHPILCCPLLLWPSIIPSPRVFSNELVRHIRWPKYWSFSFSISPSSEYSGLISFRMDWLDLFAVQGTLKRLQYHSSKASILRHSAFFTVQLSHPYMTTEKHSSWQIDGEMMETMTDFSWAPKSLQMVIAAMKLKDACSLEEKLWQT